MLLYLPCRSTRYPSDSKTSHSQLAVARFCTGSAAKCRGTEMCSTHSRSCASVMVSRRALILVEGLDDGTLREWTSFMIHLGCGGDLAAESCRASSEASKYPGAHPTVNRQAVL